MHEYSLILSLIQRVEAEMAKHNAKRVHRVVITVGELSGVEPELLSSAFEIAKEGTVCAEAQLTVNLEPARWVCSACGQPIARGEVLQCTVCGKPAKLEAGGEIFFQSMELEVDD